MKTLIFETSGEKNGILLADGGTPIAFLPLPGGPELSKRLASETHALLKAHAFLPELIAIATGPGSYTGIRVGAALAKALAFGWQIPFIGYPSAPLDPHLLASLVYKKFLEEGATPLILDYLDQNHLLH
ncbi:MAG: hypothetical protein A3E80_04455 [Chlamydiae bacterium RIFCSPHIGHO2_12_FULL_49_9]|nr:MAG: hypothetical protein A3E80_04455 [Chlamydiae bacterium RIFCSPHIGHO2_12_FULL_49_9]